MDQHAPGLVSTTVLFAVRILAKIPDTIKHFFEKKQ